MASRWTTATSALQLEGKGVRLQNIQILKGGGRGTGNAYIGWDGTYSFNFDARGIRRRIDHAE